MRERGMRERGMEGVRDKGSDVGKERRQEGGEGGILCMIFYHGIFYARIYNEQPK